MAIEYRDGAELVIEAALAGLDAGDDIEIWLTRDVLHVRARQAPGVGPGPLEACDNRYGPYARDLSVPHATTVGDVRATYRDGTLVVRFPAGGSPHPDVRRVPVAR